MSTKVKEIYIKEFRLLKDVKIPIAENITIICGQNGTSKSSILGLLAQAFNFIKDPSTSEKIGFKTLFDTNFKSHPKDHFKLSKKHDQVGSMEAIIKWRDGYFDGKNGELTLQFSDYKDRDQPRVLTRNNTLAGLHEKTSKNTTIAATHPVIYLSLKRLFPIAMRDQYTPQENAYFNQNIDKFIEITHKLLETNKFTSAVTTSGTVKSAAPYGENYDHLSVSTGEDNIGHIALAILSFMRLKEDYKDYKGGLLLIDEADAALFPAAQVSLVKALARYSKDLKLQIVMTTHSPIIIQEIYDLREKSEANKKHYKNIYLRKIGNNIASKEDLSWSEIYADLRREILKPLTRSNKNKVNIYFEDKECISFFRAIVRKRSLTGSLSIMKHVALGASHYITLYKVMIPEFYKSSIVILDGDQCREVKKLKNNYNYLVLPGELPPDQLIFEFLQNLDVSDPFWTNSLKFTRDVFSRLAHPIKNELDITDDEEINLALKLRNYNEKRIRDHFDNFMRSEEMLSITARINSENPFVYWCEKNPEQVKDFSLSLVSALQRIHRKEFGSMWEPPFTAETFTYP